MHQLNWKHVAAIIATLAIASIGLLWAWNTLADLFGGPAAEFRHVVSAIILAAGVRALLVRRHGRQMRWHA